MQRFLFGFLFCLCGAFASQKLADTPKDTPIKVRLHNDSTYCYTPSFTKGEGFVYLDDCAKAKKARYDVFNRIAWDVNGVWLCMSMPESLGSGDYLRLRPCVLNDKGQQWSVRDGAIYSLDRRFRVQDLHWYAYVSQDPKGAYDHKLVGMQEWVDTLATPVNLSLKTFIAWSFVSSGEFSTYYLKNNQSVKNTPIDLFYNPENGHIAQYNQANGELICLRSKQGRGASWDYVEWVRCDDSLGRDERSWEFFALVGRSGALRDKDGNFLRLTQYGPHWGVPYTASSSYVAQDTANAPKSLFGFDVDIERFNRYVNANLSDSLPFCPAPNTPPKPRLSLPPSFSLNERWIQRLYQIAASSNGGTERVGICGICLLQSFQIVAELQEFYASEAPLSGGYFFDTAPNTNPFLSFRARYPLLVERLNALIVSDTSLARESYNQAVMRNFEAMAETMLPRFSWRASEIAESEQDGTRLIQSMLAAPLGSLWILNVYLRDERGALLGHALPILRIQEGLMLIPTNLPNMRFADYTQYLRHNAVARTPAEAFRILIRGRYTLQAMSALSLQERYPNPIMLSVSNNNCSGEGEDRHGNGLMPASSSINQCFGGRCAIQ